MKRPILIVLVVLVVALAVGVVGRSARERTPTLPPVLAGAPADAAGRATTPAPMQVAAPVGESIPVTLTAYCLRGTTREGREVSPNLVAADPRIFPLGRVIDVFIRGEHHGRFRVSDTGAKVKGTVIDLWMSDCEDARKFGRQRGSAVLLPRSAERSS